MRRFYFALISLLFLLSTIACNKERPRKLDYTNKEKAGLYSATGLPGEGYVGQPDSATKFTDEKKTTPKAETKPATEEKKSKQKGAQDSRQ